MRDGFCVQCGASESFCFLPLQPGLPLFFSLLFCFSDVMWSLGGWLDGFDSSAVTSGGREGGVSPCRVMSRVFKWKGWQALTPHPADERGGNVFFLWTSVTVLFGCMPTGISYVVYPTSLGFVHSTVCVFNLKWCNNLLSVVCFAAFSSSCHIVQHPLEDCCRGHTLPHWNLYIMMKYICWWTCVHAYIYSFFL